MVQWCPSSITSLTTSNVKQISDTVLGWFVKNPWRKETSLFWECLTVCMFLKSADFPSLPFWLQSLFGTSMFNLESYCNIEYSFASFDYVPYTPVYLSFSKELLLLPYLFCSSLTCSYVWDQLTFYTLPILLPIPLFLVVCISIQVALSLISSRFNLILTFTCMISSYFLGQNVTLEMGSPIEGVYRKP